MPWACSQLPTRPCCAPAAAAAPLANTRRLSAPAVLARQTRPHRRFAITDGTGVFSLAGATRRPRTFAAAASSASRSGNGSSNGESWPAAAEADAVQIAIEPGPVGNSRCIWAGVEVAAPAEAVFAAMTSYETLATFIPGLAENRCLARYSDGCKLLQAGQQELALGVRFSARVVLRIREWPSGMPRRLLARSPVSGGGGGAGGGPWWPFGGASAAIPGYFGGLLGGGRLGGGQASSSSSGGSSGSSGSEEDAPASPGEWCQRWLRPRSPLGSAAAMDISFDLLEGDFSAFKGLWRVQGRPGPGPPCCRLSYSLFVRPQPWLPVNLVEQRIQAEVQANLAAVRAHVEVVAGRRSGPPR